MPITRRPATTTAVVTDEDGRRSDVQTFVLGSWEQGALQVLVDAVRGEFDYDGYSARFVERLAEQDTMLGSNYNRVVESLDALAGLVRAFSQHDRVEITATYHS